MCCSKKFKKEERVFAQKLRKLGINVYEPPLYSSPQFEKLDEQEKMAMAAGFTWRHFHKIEKSDAIFILNKDGYIGTSVNMEIGFAAALNKKIFFLENDTEYTRKILIDGIAKTPEELVKKINSVETPDVLD